MAHKKINVALLQHACRQSVHENKSTIEKAIEKAASNNAQLIVLQELHNSLYPCQTEDLQQFELAEPIPGPSTTWLADLATKHHLVIISSLFEARAPGLYHNTAVVFDRDGSMAGKYRKMHIPDDPGYYEKFYFTPGDLGFHPIQTSLGCIGVLVCWDQWYPEAARLMALAGADILVYPTAIGWGSNDSADEQQRQLNAWITIQRAHAIANGIPVLAANRVGYEADPSGQTTGIEFWGNSFITGPQGDILAQADHRSAKILYAELDLKRNTQVRQIWPFFRDRRIDGYADLIKRYRD